MTSSYDPGRQTVASVMFHLMRVKLVTAAALRRWTRRQQSFLSASVSPLGSLAGLSVFSTLFFPLALHFLP